MHNKFALRMPTVFILAAIAGTAWAADAAYTLDEVVVTAPRMDAPLTVVLDPKAPQQPVPANDGASFLKNVPGFTMTRKGGTDGDPLLRGLGGSRLNILLDGMDFHGGCGQRMDPPTAYVFPELYDKVTVIKGPQTVAYGNGNAAGVVLFEHDSKQTEPGASGAVSLLAGSWDRVDLLATGRVVTDRLYLEATASHAESDDYEDGDGTAIHSAYERESASLVAGWRPDRNTRLDLDYTASRAEAAYADRSMDGVKFDRDSYGLTFEKAHLSPLIGKLSARLYHTYIDHVMDNYSLRTTANCGTGTNNTCAVSNPDRDTDGARVSADLNLSDATVLKLGADWRDDEHTLRQRMNTTQALADAYTSLARTKDYESTTTGVFGELSHDLAGDRRVIAGLRVDNWEATRYSSGVFLADDQRDLYAGFVRYEQDLAGRPATVYVGLGHNERPMDYWEAAQKAGLDATPLAPEKTTQLDAGLLWKSDTVKGSASVFYAKVDDYLLVQWTSPSTGSPAGSVSNVDATRWGAEADLAWKLNPAWTLRGSLAWVHADNDTMSVPLAQTPPLEGRIGLDYSTGAWTFGGVLRLVAEQDRFHLNYGNVVGADLGATDGFSTLALNGSYKPNKASLVSFGVDNVFDEAYAEHVSRTGLPDVTGYTTVNTRVNEPGRFFWLKLNYNFD